MKDERTCLAFEDIIDGLPTIDVVVCVHNALAHITACWESLKKLDYPPHKLRVVFVDDGSEKSTGQYLDSVAEKSNCRLIRHERALGYTRAANAGLKASQADCIVLLNSDTIVSRSFLTKMSLLLKQNPDVGLVGPLSNAASWQSVPNLSDCRGDWKVNQLPEGWSVDDMDRLLERSGSLFPRVPLISGFCLMIRNVVPQTIGYMDEENFPRGYGEENDYCFRASDAGFGLMVATNAYVYHSKSKSYGHENRKALSNIGGKTLIRKYGKARIDRAVKSLQHNSLLQQIREEVHRSL